mgnify:CR=1 FL=1
MRKLSILFALTIFLGLGAQAQQADVTSAILSFQKASSGNAERDWVNAKTYIDRAWETYSEKNGAGVKEKIASKLFYYRGEIYYFMYISRDSVVSALAPENALDLAYESYSGLFDVDVKDRYTKDATKKLAYVATAHVNEAYDHIDKEKLGREPGVEDYAQALTEAEMALEIRSKEPLAGRIKDTLTTYLAAVLAANAQNPEKSKMYLRKLIEMDHKTEYAYAALAKTLKAEGSTDEAISVLQEGQAKHPDNLDLIIEEVNIYIQNKENDKALKPLQSAIAADPSNAILHNTIGTIQLQLGNEEEARVSFLKAAELDSTLNDPWYQLGFIEVAKANEIIKKMNDLPFGDKRYDALNKKKVQHFKDALPYFEKALEADPENKDTLVALKEVYYALDMRDKMLEVVKTMKALGYQ